jgi:hypothetical protein
MSTMNPFEKPARSTDPKAYIEMASQCLARGQEGRAKYWLRHAPLHPQAQLVAAGLYAKSRSVRATRFGKVALAIATRHRDTLSEVDRASLDRLQLEFAKRNPEAWWSPNQQRISKGRSQRRDE